MQYRMARPIGNLISHCFYRGELISKKEFTKAILISAKVAPKPVTWFCTSSKPGKIEIAANASIKNLAEVEEIKNILLRLQFAAKSDGSRYEVVVLSGYLGQVSELKRALAGLEGDLHNLDVECCTVDTFQGKEADIAIYSVTRSNYTGKIGFLKEKERLNVALSRGKELLCIVGNSKFCGSIVGENPFIKVLEHIRSNPNDCTIVGD